MVRNKIEDIVTAYRESEFEDEYTFVEEADNPSVHEVLNVEDTELARERLNQLYELGANEGSVERQIREEEEVFEDEYEGEGRLRASLFFALVEVLQEVSHTEKTVQEL